MISEAEFRALLALKTETKNLDCKESLNWDTATNDAKCELVKDILAFFNTQDGGSVIFGVQDATLKPIGLHSTDFASFDTTRINDFVSRYTDPLATCEVQKLTVDNKLHVVITVPEFKDIPIICKKAANSSANPSRTILRLGGIYVRTDKATSEIVPTAEQMRELMNRALLRRGDQLLATIQGLLRGTPAPGQSEMERYKAEVGEAHEYFKKVLPKDFEEYGYWELTTMPQTYSPERIATIGDIRKALTEAEVALRGWNFPHTDRENTSNFQSGFQSNTEFMHHVHAHRAYKSGLFIWRSSFWENFSTFAKDYGRALSYVNVIYTVTEFFVFLKRFYERTLPEGSIHLILRMTDIENRRLVTTGEAFLAGNYAAKVPELRIEQDYSVSELRASAEELAIKVIQQIFEVFNWNSPDPNLIRGWQQKLLSRTF